MRKPTVTEWIDDLRSGVERTYPYVRVRSIADGVRESVSFSPLALADLLESLDNPKDLDRDTMKADAANPSQLDPDR